MNHMNRREHIRWCEERAICAYDYSAKAEPRSAVRNGIASMASDLGKHPETERLQALCSAGLMNVHSRNEFVAFIHGFI